MNAPFSPAPDLLATPFRQDVQPYLDPKKGDLESETGASTPLYLRSDPGALSYHVQHYIRNGDPAAWNAKLESEHVNPDYDDEPWPLPLVDSRSLDTATVNALVSTAGPSGSRSKGGHMALLTVGRFKVADEKYPEIDLRPGSLKNAAGEWVAPTAAAVTAGIEAGIKVENGQVTLTEDAALTDASAKGAYPLTWANWLMAPASGLSADKANAVASVARYLATAGQAANETFGEPTLPQQLVDLALKRADEIVERNCTGDGRHVITRNDAGPFSPAALPSGVSIKWCEQAITPAATTTTSHATTTRPTTTSQAATPTSTSPTPATSEVTAPDTNEARDSGAPSSGRTRPNTNTTAAPSSTDVPSTTAPPSSTDHETTSDTPTPVDLVFDTPTASRTEFDRTTTMMFGGGVFYLGLRRFRRKRPS
jgi:hypothetical protein